MRGFNDFNEFNNEFNCESFVSVPMRGFNDFNLTFTEKTKLNSMFPSPCGVLMILIVKILQQANNNALFPSPCGVLMILIR